MIKKMFLILIIILLLFCSNNVVQANNLGDIITGGQNFIESGSKQTPIASDSIKNLSDTIYNILLVLGTVIAVIIGAILGIQFITGSVEQKAKVKDSLIPFIVGCVVIFGAFGIWKLVITILR